MVAIGCGDHSIKMLNIEKGELTNTLKESHEDAVNGVVINQDNSTLYSIGQDGNLKTWK